MELKHGWNGARGAEILKIRHLGPKRRRFGLLKKKKIYIVLFSVTDKKSPRASLSSPMAEIMEKKKKNEKTKKNKGKKLEHARGKALPPRVVAPRL